MLKLQYSTIVYNSLRVLVCLFVFGGGVDFVDFFVSFFYCFHSESGKYQIMKCIVEVNFVSQSFMFLFIVI